MFEILFQAFSAPSRRELIDLNHLITRMPIAPIDELQHEPSKGTISNFDRQHEYRLEQPRRLPNLPATVGPRPAMNAADRTFVLMYHRVGEVRSAAESLYCIAPERFAAQMNLLARRGYRAVPIDALVAWLEGGPTLKKGDFVLTFDDGFLGVREYALPILEQLGWPFTVFLVTSLLGGADMWQRFNNLEGRRYPLLSVDDVRHMRLRGCSFHSHTETHASLPSADDGTLAAELAGSRAALSNLLGDHAAYLAYPYGHLDDRVESATRAAGYKAAFSVQPGFIRRDVNPFRIPRLDIFGTDTPSALLRKVRLGGNDGSLTQVAKYYWSRVADRWRP